MSNEQTRESRINALLSSDAAGRMASPLALAAAFVDAETERDALRAELANIRAAGALAVMEGARIADEATARLDEYKREVERRDELLHGADEDLKEARTTAKPSEEARAGLEAVVERLVEALRDAAQTFRQTHVNHCSEAWTSRGLHATECLLADAMDIDAALAAAAPSKVLAERESALKARIAELESRRGTRGLCVKCGHTWETEK